MASGDGAARAPDGRASVVAGEDGVVLIAVEPSWMDPGRRAEVRVDGAGDLVITQGGHEAVRAALGGEAEALRAAILACSRVMLVQVSEAAYALHADATVVGEGSGYVGGGTGTD